MNEELKPCPFCGKNDIRIRSDKHTDGKFHNSLVCKNCKAEAYENIWNTRVALSEVALSKEIYSQLLNHARYTTADEGTACIVINPGGQAPKIAKKILECFHIPEEIVWPEKQCCKKHSLNDNDFTNGEENCNVCALNHVWNSAIDACKVAVEKAKEAS